MRWGGASAAYRIIMDYLAKYGFSFAVSMITDANDDF